MTQDPNPLSVMIAQMVNARKTAYTIGYYDGMKSLVNTLLDENTNVRALEFELDPLLRDFLVALRERLVDIDVESMKENPDALEGD